MIIHVTQGVHNLMEYFERYKSSQVYIYCEYESQFIKYDP